MRLVISAVCFAIAACSAPQKAGPGLVVVRGDRQLEAGEGQAAATESCPAGTSAAFIESYWNENFFECLASTEAARTSFHQASRGRLMVYTVTRTPGPDRARKL